MSIKQIKTDKWSYTTDNELGTKGPGQYVKMKNGKAVKVITFLGSEEKTEQAQRALTDVHALLEPAIKRGLLRHSYDFEGEYDDIPALTYEDALNVKAKAESMFEQLPSAWRNKFNNDPKQFLEFTQNPDNGPEMAKMGMLRGNDGFTISGTPSNAPTDLNNDGKVDTIDTNADGVPDSNPPETV
jgi:phage internal scaffolding protein